MRAIKQREGAVVKKGQQLVSLSSNYTGGNVAAINLQIAQKQYEQSTATYDIQKEAIAKQKEVAQKSEENSAELRELARTSLDETRSQLSLNESILATINENLTTLEQATSSAANDALILSTRQLQSQYVSAVNQLKNAIRTGEYSNSEDELPAELGRLQRDITIKQLEAQEKALEIGKEVAGLNVKLAQINVSLYFPASPFAGTIEKVHVRVGQLVNPGTPLITLAGTSGQTQIVVLVDESTAGQVSKLEPSVISAKGQTVSVVPVFVSNEPTQERLFSIIYSVPDSMAATLSDKDYVTVHIPVGYADSGSAVPFVPIDAIYQTQDLAYVFTASESSAISVPVTLGQVYGRFVAVEGLPASALVILDRNVLAGDPITITTE